MKEQIQNDKEGDLRTYLNLNSEEAIQVRRTEGDIFAHAIENLGLSIKEAERLVQPPELGGPGSIEKEG